MLLFDLTALQSDGATKKHGGGKYAEIVFCRILARTTLVIGWFDSSRDLDERIAKMCQQNNILMVDSQKNELQNIVDDLKIDTIYSAIPQESVLRIQNCRIIVTLHGLRNLEIPHELMNLQYPLSFKEKIKELGRILFTKRAYRKAYAYYELFFKNPNLEFVTVSNHTKYAIASFFPFVKIDKISVFYSPSTSVEDNQWDNAERKNYFLLVSANRIEKNNIRAIKALDELFEEGKLDDFCVKVVGLKSSQLSYRLKNISRFEFLGYVEDDLLNRLYASACCLIYPSFTEGFGYPPLEAMRYGTPVMASPLTAISEICQNAALYFNPFSISELKNRALQMSTDECRKTYSELGRIRYKEVLLRQKEDLKKLIDFILGNE